MQQTKASSFADPIVYNKLEGDEYKNVSTESEFIDNDTYKVKAVNDSKECIIYKNPKTTGTCLWSYTEKPFSSSSPPKLVLESEKERIEFSSISLDANNYFFVGVVKSRVAKLHV
jgi:hypothetical protein